MCDFAGGGVNAALKKKTYREQDCVISNQHWNLLCSVA